MRQICRIVSVSKANSDRPRQIETGQQTVNWITVQMTQPNRCANGLRAVQFVFCIFGELITEKHGAMPYIGIRIWRNISTNKRTNQKRKTNNNSIEIDLIRNINENNSLWIYRMGWSKALRRFSGSPALNERTKQPINHFSRRIGNVGIGITNAVDIYRVTEWKRDEMKNAVQFSSSNERTVVECLFMAMISHTHTDNTHRWLGGCASNFICITVVLAKENQWRRHLFGTHLFLATHPTGKRMCRNDTTLFGQH